MLLYAFPSFSFQGGDWIWETRCRDYQKPRERYIAPCSSSWKPGFMYYLLYTSRWVTYTRSGCCEKLCRGSSVLCWSLENLFTRSWQKPWVPTWIRHCILTIRLTRATFATMYKILKDSGDVVFFRSSHSLVISGCLGRLGGWLENPWFARSEER